MIITGHPRSGTATAAKIFGLTHELFFGPYRRNLVIDADSPLPPDTNEASWLAQPYAAKLMLAKVRVIHLVRNPVDVVSSMLGIKFFETPSIYLEYMERHLITDHCFFDWSSATPVLKAVYAWWRWNKPLSLLDIPRIRIEDIAFAPRINTRERAEFSWKQVPKGKTKRFATDLAMQYGYKLVATKREGS